MSTEKSIVLLNKSCSAEDAKSRLLEVVQKCVDKQKTSTSHVFTVGLSGGSLPLVLSEILPKVSTDWKKWKFFFCDERLLPFSDPESTFGAYKRQLMPNLPQISSDQFVSIDPSLQNSDSAEDYNLKLIQVFGRQLPRFDLLLLGLGPDGHTCSLFPNDNQILNVSRDQWVAFVSNSPKPPPKRITLTLPVLNNAKCCLFYATGAAKARVLREILVEKKSLPAALVRPTDGTLYWILDDESAQELNDVFVDGQRSVVLKF